MGLILCAPVENGLAEPNKKVLNINSYHQGSEWSDGITRGVESRLLVEDVDLETYFMDAKRNSSPIHIERVSAQIKNLIDSTQPDVVIIADDIAVKYVLESYYKNAPIPFIFCGVNWDASVYDLPYQNTTGMLETSFIESIVDLLSQYAAGKRIGLLSIDAYSEHRSLEHYNQVLDRNIDETYFVNTMQEWEAQFLRLQDEVDMMILENPEGIENWDQERALKFVQQEARIPVGSAHAWLAPLSLITIAKKPEEQGWWAAEQAMQILGGKSPAEIPISENTEGKLFANMIIANKLGVTFAIEILQTATLIKK